MNTPLLCLASASPRRSALLTQIGVPHHVTAAHIDETARPSESPEHYVQRMAQTKAERVWADAAARGSLPVLAADTTVVIDDQMLGKPRHAADAATMLLRLSGRVHRVLSAVCLITDRGGGERLSVTEVRFRALDEALCAAYWASGEPCDKAGAYAIQGLGAVFIESIQGSYSGVVGLPLCETAELLTAAGLVYWRGAA